MKTKLWAFAFLMTSIPATHNLYAAEAGGAKQGNRTYTAEQLASLRKAAEQGDVAAQVKLGEALHSRAMDTTDWWTPEGEMSPDNIEAAKWYRLAAEQGSPEGQSHYGYMFLLGDGVTENRAEAKRWFELSANQGYVAAMVALGESIYLRNHDYSSALRWLRKAAEQGDKRAIFLIGLAYYFGNGVPQDYSAAGQWILRAAEQGEKDAQLNLSEMYEEGKGVPVNPSEAMKWRLIAKGPEFKILEIKFDDRMTAKKIKESPVYNLPEGQKQEITDTLYVKREVTNTDEEWMKGTAKLTFPLLEAGIQKEARKVSTTTDTTGEEIKRSITIVGNGHPVSVVWNELYRTGTAKVKVGEKISDVKFEYKDTFELTLQSVN